MKVNKVKQLLQQYFNGESSLEDEKTLMNYFRSGDVAEEVQEYAEFFGGMNELADQPSDTNFQEEIMDYILEQEHIEKRKYRSMWQLVTGIAASVIIILGGVLYYQQQQQPFEDTFDTPEEAYVQAVKALQLMGSKYQAGVDQLASLQKINSSMKPLAKMEILEDASKPLIKGAKTFSKGFNEYERLNNIENQ